MSASAIKPILICYDGSEGARTTPSRRPANCSPDARRSCCTPGARWPSSAPLRHAWHAPSYDDEALQDEASKVAEEGCSLAKEAGLKAQPEIAEVTYEGTWHTILDIARPVRRRADRARRARALDLQVDHARLRVPQRRAARSPPRADRAPPVREGTARAGRARRSDGMRRRTSGDRSPPPGRSARAAGRALANASQPRRGA